jgi:antitoxin (DNA-binding transcriptional repressor) of toxin-antitoxin stability system
MIEVTIARLRANLASILGVVRAGRPVLIRRNRIRIAVLAGTEAEARRAARVAAGGASKLPTRTETGPVVPVRIRGKLRRAPSRERSDERE